MKSVFTVKHSSQTHGLGHDNKQNEETKERKEEEEESTEKER